MMIIRISNKNVIIDKEDLFLICRYKWRIRDGYVVSTKKGIRLHRLILGINTEIYDTNTQIDHINRDKLDNRKSNLRICTSSENSTNRVVLKNNKSSIYRGVYKHKNKWRAQIKCKNVKIPLGLYDNEKDAAIVYDKAAIYYHGEYAVINFGNTT